jgi:hypothetical protein
MPGGITVDASRAIQGMQRLAKGLEKQSRTRGMERARKTVKDIKPNVPVLTGRLRATVKANPINGGGEVTYGSSATPYAWKIERRTHAVQNAVPATVGQFEKDMVDGAQKEIAAL